MAKVTIRFHGTPSVISEALSVRTFKQYAPFHVYLTPLCPCGDGFREGMDPSLPGARLQPTFSKSEAGCLQIGQI